jgi:hypothetical protein
MVLRWHMHRNIAIANIGHFCVKQTQLVNVQGHEQTNISLMPHITEDE